MPENRVTLKRIAQETALTVAAVSLALRNKPGVSVETRERVHATARRLGYRRDPALQVLADMRWGKTPVRRAPNLAIYTEAREVPPVIQSEMHGIRQEAARLGYGVEVVSDAASPDPTQLARMLRARGVEAILVGFHGERPQWRPPLDFSRFTVVGINSLPQGMSMHQVRMNFYQHIEQAWQQLRARGFSRIGYCHVAGDPQAEIDRRRLAFHMWVQAYATLPAERVRAFNLRTETADVFQEWLRTERPDALLLALSSSERIERFTPREIPLFSLDACGSIPGITTESVDVGRAAVRILDSLYRSGEKGLTDAARVHLVPGRWRDGSDSNSNIREVNKNREQ